MSNPDVDGLKHTPVNPRLAHVRRLSDGHELSDFDSLAFFFFEIIYYWIANLITLNGSEEILG